MTKNSNYKPTYRQGEEVIVSYTTQERGAQGQKVLKHGLDLGRIAAVVPTVGGGVRYYLAQPDGSGVDWSMGFRAEEIKRA